MKLYCMRHGEAVDAIQDQERPLTEAGTAGVQRLASHLQHIGVHFDHVMSSEVLRAQKTAEIMASQIAPSLKIETMSSLTENSECEGLLSDLLHWNDDTLLVGHLPMMDDLVSQLLTRTAGSFTLTFVPGTIVCLEKQQMMRWSLAWMINPEMILPSG